MGKDAICLCAVIAVCDRFVHISRDPVLVKADVYIRTYVRVRPYCAYR